MKLQITMAAYILMSGCQGIDTGDEKAINCFSEERERSLTLIDFKGEHLKVYLNDTQCIDKRYTVAEEDSSGFSGFENLNFKARDKVTFRLGDFEPHEIEVAEQMRYIVVLNDPSTSKIEIIQRREFGPLD